MSFKGEKKMNKEELIALSDLNREDNIKYISSEAQGIAIALNSDKYAPTLCKLERAYICGRRKSEEQIEQLEKENAELIGKVAFLENDLNNVKAQIERMKSDVMANIKWADKNCDNMWQKLVKMWNEWENKYGK